MPNSSSISEFLLLALADTRQLQLLHFWLLLGIYLAALLGNGLISTAVACDHRLHTPMYFFLLNLALLDLGCISTTLPKAMANALWHTRAISYAGCAAQVFFFVFFLSAEYCILTVMSYDRYVAICKPLHYGTLLGSRACATMAAAVWGTGSQQKFICLCCHVLLSVKVEEQLTYAGVVQGPRTQLQHAAASSVFMGAVPHCPGVPSPYLCLRWDCCFPGPMATDSSRRWSLCCCSLFTSILPSLSTSWGTWVDQEAGSGHLSLSASHNSHFQHCLHVDGRSFS
uniref:G-protein coupled receptors family 1 profile domain-containing protein n=1 Tax=Gallus gallus TaxID=9031 RepID=A0A8V0X3U3_CHICK